MRMADIGGVMFKCSDPLNWLLTPAIQLHRNNWLAANKKKPASAGFFIYAPGYSKAGYCLKA
jgi:hypothetical protein